MLIHIQTRDLYLVAQQQKRNLWDLGIGDIRFRNRLSRTHKLSYKCDLLGSMPTKRVQKGHCCPLGRHRSAETETPVSWTQEGRMYWTVLVHIVKRC